jgi:hypothetical protein
MTSPFEHHSSFEQGEVTGNVRLGKLEATYSEMFADVIQDGVITAEERQQLDRMAEALGLDRQRLHSLEHALTAAWEAKQRVRIVDLSDAEPASMYPIEPSTDPRMQPLKRRIAELEARVMQLEKELAEARANLTVEVDVTEMEEDAASLHRRVSRDPRDPETLHALFRAHADPDRRWCIAQALVFLGQATDEEKSAFAAHRPEGLIRPKTSLTREGWQRHLFHPEEEILTGEIFSVIVSAVLLGRVSALKRDKQLPLLDPARRQDPATSTVQAVRCFSWAGSILGMTPPTLYVDPDFEPAVQMVPGIPPVTRLGQRSLSGRSPVELAFLAGRHLAWYREERFVRLLVPSIVDLEDLFLCALLIGNPGIPLRADAKRRVVPLAQAIEPILEPAHVDRLRALFLRFVEDGGRTNLQRWATAAELTACRAGLLLANDLKAAAAMIQAEDGESAQERIDDLIVFVTGDRYAALRKQIGIAL